MAQVRIELNGAALRSVAIQSAAQDLRIRANRVLNAARRAAPVDTGTLRASLHTEFSALPDGSPVARIGTNVPYAIFVHEGTGIYGPSGTPITPKNGQYLRFTPRGASRPVYARSVRGVRGRPFLAQALDAAR